MKDNEKYTFLARTLHCCNSIKFIRDIDNERSEKDNNIEMKSEHHFTELNIRAQNKLFSCRNLQYEFT